MTAAAEISERPFADGRLTAVFVFNELRADGGRLTQLWLARLRAFDAAGWSTHAAFINKDARLLGTVGALVADGRMPAGTAVHHYALRDRRIRPSWWGPLPAGGSIDPRVGDWLDWLTGQVPGAVVFADSPAAYPYLSHMTNPLVARVAGIHLNHLMAAPAGTDPALAPMTPRFAERFADHQQHFDSLVVMTATQATDLRTRFGSDTPVEVIPPGVPRPPAAPAPDTAAGPRRIVSVGHLDPAARHADAIAALHAVAAEHPDVVLEIVGEGELEADLRARAAGLGLADRVRVTPPGPDEDAPFVGAALTVWTGRRESCPLSIIRSLAHGVPVVARDARYGPAELVTSPALGDVVPSAAALAEAVGRRLAAGPDPAAVRAAAGALLRRTDPAAVGARWVALAEGLALAACDHRSPSLLVESMSTNTRVMRLPGILADSASALGAWSCELPGLAEPAGWLVEPPPPPGTDVAEEDDEPPVHPHAAGPSREVVVQLRSNALAFVAAETGRPFRVEFTDGTGTSPLLAPAFSDRIIASRVGNATLSRRADGSVWVAPRDGLLFASNIDGRLLVRTSPEEPPSDVTHAIDWIVDIDWADLRQTPDGASFAGTLRAIGIAPADDSPPSICVSDVGGFSRAVGLLHYRGAPRISGTEWTADVSGVIEADPLVATTQLARGALPLHVGYRGLLVPIGGLWTHGRRERILLTSPRGEVTLLPSPGGRVLAAPGRGVRARVSGVVRTLVGRG